MSYTSYKQQYTFGFKENSIKSKTLTSASSLFYGTEVGDKASLALCKPIDLKKAGVLAYNKALCSLCILETPDMGVRQKVKIAVSGTATADGSVAFTGFGETLSETLEIDISEDGATAADIAQMIGALLSEKLKTWNVSVNASNEVIIERVDAKANITVNSTNFGVAVTGLTSATIGATGTVASVTSGTTNDAVLKFIVKTMGADANGDPDTDHAQTVITVDVKCAEAKPSSQPFQQFTMPSNTKEFIALELSTDKESATWSAGKFLMKFDPFI